MRHCHDEVGCAYAQGLLGGAAAAAGAGGAAWLADEDDGGGDEDGEDGDYVKSVLPGPGQTGI